MGILCGSRGSGYEREGFLHGNGGGGGGGPEHFPVEANVRIKNKTTEGALQEFRDKHVAEDHEFAYVIDDQGYVHEYNEGDYGSVATLLSKSHPMSSYVGILMVLTFRRQ